MAYIEVKGFVSDWKYQTSEPNPNWAMKVAEPHSRKVGDEYVKMGRTNWTIKNGWDAEAGKAAEIDFQSFKSGDRVLIKGIQVTEESESNGTKYKNLIIKATSVELLEPSQRNEIPNAWVEVEEPF